MMNVDAFTMFCVVSVVCVFCVALFYFLNTNVSFANAKPNSVYSFDYVQPLTGERTRKFAKVIQTRKFDNYWLNYLDMCSNYRRTDPMFKRTNNLVMCKMTDGTIRQFYAERVVNCRRIPLAGRLYRFASFV
jgi:hypothetical protein